LVESCCHVGLLQHSSGSRSVQIEDESRLDWQRPTRHSLGEAHLDDNFLLGSDGRWQEWDALVVTELDRPARSVVHLVEIGDRLQAKGIFEYPAWGLTPTPQPVA
jgi:hypothetical protein